MRIRKRNKWKTAFRTYETYNLRLKDLLGCRQQETYSDVDNQVDRTLLYEGMYNSGQKDDNKKFLWLGNDYLLDLAFHVTYW